MTSDQCPGGVCTQRVFGLKYLNTTLKLSIRSALPVGLVVCVLIGFVALLWDSLRWAADQSPDRIEREHGIVLPASATDIQCGGDAWKRWFDRGASSIFVIDPSDWSLIKGQLTRAPGNTTFVPGNDEYRRFRFPWRQGIRPVEVLSCRSRTGDWMHVEIRPVDDQRLGVWVYTDWN